MSNTTPLTSTPRVRRLSILGTLLALAVLLTGCQTTAPNPGGDIPSTVVGLTFIPNIQFAPFYIADSAGFYTDEVAISLRHHGAQEGLFTALEIGDEQFVVAGGDEILQARAQGIDIVAVASYYGQYPARIIVPESSSITSVADLKGQRIGLPGKYGENWFALLIALKEAGLTEDDVTIMEIGYTLQAALTTDKVDAVIGFANSDALAFAKAGFAIRAIDPKVPLVSICLGATSVYVESHPEIVQAVVDAMKRGMQAALDDVEATLTIAANYIPDFRDETLATARIVLPATTMLFLGEDGTTVSPPLRPADWTAMARAMESVGLISAGTDESTAFTTTFSG
ncbi:MAG: ABC transporter substrate-binding protein [Propionibacteriaceae bacterium]|jgi:NitT/TauT family transport system substrate-binding protein|nr:ABC transporter substrate-binding protein [Propionibacteriaceae bacterium]